MSRNATGHRNSDRDLCVIGQHESAEPVKWIGTIIFFLPGEKKTMVDKLLAILMATHPRLGADSLLASDVTLLIANQYHTEVR